jgi:hypothetical protein
MGFLFRKSSFHVFISFRRYTVDFDFGLEIPFFFLVINVCVQSWFNHYFPFLVLIISVALIPYTAATTLIHRPVIHQGREHSYFLFLETQLGTFLFPLVFIPIISYPSQQGSPPALNLITFFKGTLIP